MNSAVIVPIGTAGFSNEDSETMTCSPAAAREELQRILSSSQFDASERNRRFLVYVVEETLAGRGERIKAYSIATIVFGRDDSFDPQLDPVVRMEARRLRRSLERFYLVEGEGHAVRIAMPKGSYKARFENAVLAPGTMTLPPKDSCRSRVSHNPTLFAREIDRPANSRVTPAEKRRSKVCAQETLERIYRSARCVRLRQSWSSA